MLQQIAKAPINALNSKTAGNLFSRPNVVKHYVGALVLINGVTRVIASEMDKNEKPAARHYAAAINGLQEGFALAAHYLLTPLFAAGGLLLGKHLIARGAFKNIASKMKLSHLQESFMPKNAAEKGKGFLGRIFKGAQRRLGIDDINQGLARINQYNRIVLNKAREAVVEGRQIIVQTGDDTFRVVKQGKDNLMKALDNEAEAFGAAISKKQAEEMNAVIIPLLKHIGGKKDIHNNIIGSQKIGETLGMATALTVVSPYFSIKIVPTLLKKLGLAQEEDQKTKITKDTDQVFKEFENFINQSD